MINRKLKIDVEVFRIAFGRDADYHDVYPRSVFLDLDTGEVLWVYKDDEHASLEEGIPKKENKANRELISDNPQRYLKIPGLSHGDHHRILQDFLESEWTDDKELWQETKDAYFGSIGAWKKGIDDESVVHRYLNYRDSAIRAEAIALLASHGIESIDEIS